MQSTARNTNNRKLSAIVIYKEFYMGNFITLIIETPKYQSFQKILSLNFISYTSLKVVKIEHRKLVIVHTCKTYFIAIVSSRCKTHFTYDFF